MAFTVSPLHTNLQVANFQRCKRAFTRLITFMCLEYIVTCVHPLQVVVLLCTLLYSTVYSSTVTLFQAQDPNVEQYTKAAAAVKNAIQCYHVIHDKKTRATTQTSWDRFVKRVDRIESSKEPELVPSTSGVSEIAACPPSPIADNPSALPSPTSSPSSSQ